MDTVRTQNSFGCSHRCQRFFELLQGESGGRGRRLADEIRFCDGYTPLQMDFQQVAISDLQNMIGRIHIDDRFIACGVEDPSDGVWRYGLACCCHMKPGKGSEGRKIDPARPRREVEDRAGRGKIGIGRFAMNDVFSEVAAHQLIATISATPGIVT
ncbi:hypothetical protein [Bradyrhizobium sp. CCBAU 11357]|uniref:hypothetical protein n=1 Tax=Bradyrhizobium sp. CCBAU 11357 TaxID=1630808 RepID=UPI0023033B0D|nr:hypothetical protein [Bradyrhizobium sp. CCBAU 11357]MDA9498976.1 hypothetical protein [Bradyrhizobium sp. CCBAU 11357]